jgi:hypothetical protein
LRHAKRQRRAHLPVFGVLDHAPVAGKLLLGGLEDLLGIVGGGEALDGGQRLAAVALLDPDVDRVAAFLLRRGKGRLLLIVELFVEVGRKGVCRARARGVSA